MQEISNDNIRAAIRGFCRQLGIPIPPTLDTAYRDDLEELYYYMLAFFRISGMTI